MPATTSLVGRFYVSTDDAYVRANNTMLGARVAGHVASILAGDNTTVRAGDVIFRIDDGDYQHRGRCRARAGSRPSRPPSIASAARSRRSTAQVAQAKAQLASAEAGAQARRSRLRAPAGAEQQGLCLARHVRELGSRTRPGRRRGQGGAGRLRRRGRQCRGAPRRSRPKRSAQLAELQDLARQGRARSRLHRGARAGRRHVLATAWSAPATSSRPASGSATSCRSTTSISTPTSRKPSSSASVPASR